MMFKLALTLLPFAAMGQTSLPGDFNYQCCVGNNDLVTPAVDNIAGIDDTRCYDDGDTSGFNCYSPLAVCTDLLPAQPGAPNAYICEESGTPFNCCVEVGGVERIVGDIPWTCGAALGGQRAIISTADGFYCGPLPLCKDGSVCGDPHFRTWENEWYDFHGECDLTFLKNPSFNNGLGMNIHLRTRARYEYSYVETAAVQIGSDVLQVSAWGDYLFNGVEKATMPNIVADQYEITYQKVNQKRHMFTIKLDKEEVVRVSTFKDLVAVELINATEATYHRSEGMLGSFISGNRLSRDGQIIKDDVEFGMEWQVRDDEPMLFEDARFPQYPQKCTMPSKSASAQRRLGETISYEAAQAACDAVDHIHFENCVYDVMATGDIEMVHAGVF